MNSTLLSVSKVEYLSTFPVSFYFRNSPFCEGCNKERVCVTLGFQFSIQIPTERSLRNDVGNSKKTQNIWGKSTENGVLSDHKYFFMNILVEEITERTYPFFYRRSWKTNSSLGNYQIFSLIIWIRSLQYHCQTLGNGCS